MLPAAAEDSKVYHSINPIINLYYMACSAQMNQQNMFRLLTVNRITQADIITAEEDMTTGHTFSLEKGRLPNSIKQSVFSNRRWTTQVHYMQSM